MSRKRAARANDMKVVSRREARNSSLADRRPEVRQPAEAHLLYCLIESLEIGVANISPSGTILYANRRFIEMLRATPMESVIGVSLSCFIAAASWPSLRRALSLAITNRVQGQMEIEPPSGRPRTIQLSLMPICADGQNTMMITATEVTELVEKNKALRATEDSLHTLSARILQLQDQERRSIARDLHDITGQELAAVIMSLNQVANRVSDSQDNAQQILGETIALVRKIEDDIRTLSYVLHPPLLDEFGLRSALSWYAEGFRKRSGIEVSVDAARDLPRLSTEKETALFRVVQESLTNVLRHSSSSKAVIRLRSRDGKMRLSIEDEGCGIEPEPLARISEGITAGVGTQGMRERLQQLGGSLTLRARTHGARVTATVPLDPIDMPMAESGAPAPEASGNQNADEKLLSARTAKRILIADDHDVTRQGVRSLLKDETDLEICGEAVNGIDAVAKARELDPDLIIMDISMPGASGFSAATNLRDSGARCKILFFTTHTYYEIERMSLACGYEGLVTKTNAARDLVRAVRAVLAGKKFYDSEVVEVVAKGTPRRRSKRAAAR